MSHSKLPLSNPQTSSGERQPACRLVAASAHAPEDQPRAAGTLVRVLGRPNTLTAQRVEVGIVLHAMLGMQAAIDYFGKHGVNDAVAERVLSGAGRRRGNHDANGIRT
jgi:hypothetical protein